MSAAAKIADAVLEATVVGSFSRIGYQARRRLFRWTDPGPSALAGRHVVVTGATSGIGFEVAAATAAAGAQVTIVGRDPDRVASARTRLEQNAAATPVRAAIADLSDLASVRALADELLEADRSVDVLVHNAGSLVHERRTTVDGLELTAQTHVVAPHLLTALLLPLLDRAPGGGRVVTVSSGGMYTQALRDVGRLADPPTPFDGTRTYARAKRAQVILTAEWAERAAHTGVTFHAMHPGWVDTPGLAAALPAFRDRLRPLLRTPAQGADTVVWLAHEDAALLGSGGFWLDRHRRWVDHLPWTHTSPAVADQLWEWVDGAAGVDPVALGPRVVPLTASRGGVTHVGGAAS